MIDKMSYSFLGGPPLVKAATGEVVCAEDLGGARVHTHISGGADHFCTTQDDAIEKVREILSMERPQQLQAARVPEKPPKVGVQTIYELLPSNLYRGVNVRPFLEAISDESIFLEYKKDYARGCGDNVIAGKMRIKGIAVGVIAANQMGIIFTEAAKKATEWIIRCSLQKVPLLFVQVPRIHDRD